jgi:hypothetical protein
VAEDVTYELDTLVAVVTVMGEEAVPPIKPFCEMTGPENVVFAIAIFLTYKWSASVCMSSAGTV